MLEDGLPAGSSRCDSRANGAGAVLAFEGVVGSPRPDRVVAGEASLDAEGGWARVRIAVDGSAARARRAGADALLYVEGAPALLGITAQRLIRSGMRPGQSQDVDVVRVRADGSVRAVKGRCVWVGGRDWRLFIPLESTGFSVRPDGAVAGVEGAALLVE